MQDHLHAIESETEVKMRDRITSIVYDKELIFSISFFALAEALRNHPNIKSLLFDLIISQDVLGTCELSRKSVADRLKNDQSALAYYNKLLPLYDEYLNKMVDIIHELLNRMHW